MAGPRTMTGAFGKTSLAVGLDVTPMVRTLQKQMSAFDLRHQLPVIRESVKKAGAPIVSKAKALVPVRSGALRKSLTMVVRTYKKSGTVLAMVGAERNTFYTKAKGRGSKKFNKGAYKNKTVPANYTHLVEYGSIQTRGKRNKTKVLVKPKPFIAPALAASRMAADDEMAKGFADALQKEMRRAARRAGSKML